jgi:hypothetical protein
LLAVPKANTGHLTPGLGMTPGLMLEKLRSISQDGKRPISLLVLVSHSADGGYNFSKAVVELGDRYAPSWSRVKQGKLPPMCWFQGDIYFAACQAANNPAVKELHENLLDWTTVYATKYDIWYRQKYARLWFATLGKKQVGNTQKTPWSVFKAPEWTHVEQGVFQGALV